MRIEVKRVTPEYLFREAAKMTTGKECKMSWRKALASGHSIIRTQMYFIKMYDIHLSVASHFRTHKHAEQYQLSKRPDRDGEDMGKVCDNITTLLSVMYDDANNGQLAQETIGAAIKEIRTLPHRFDRKSPTDEGIFLNAEEIINISKVRLCTKASEETRKVWKGVISELAKIDPDLASFCVPTCVYRGGICPEPKCCGYNKSDIFNKQLENYKNLFNHGIQ